MDARFGDAISLTEMSGSGKHRPDGTDDKIFCLGYDDERLIENHGARGAAHLFAESTRRNCLPVIK
jgi:hypothetical protein